MTPKQRQLCPQRTNIDVSTSGSKISTNNSSSGSSTTTSSNRNSSNRNNHSSCSSSSSNKFVLTLSRRLSLSPCKAASYRPSSASRPSIRPRLNLKSSFNLSYLLARRPSVSSPQSAFMIRYRFSVCVFSIVGVQSACTLFCPHDSRHTSRLLSSRRFGLTLKLRLHVSVVFPKINVPCDFAPHAQPPS